MTPSGDGASPVGSAALKTDPGRIALESVLRAADRLAFIRGLKLPRALLAGVNAVENWNGATSFVFFGKSGEIATDRLEDREIAALSLHLLQNALVYANTRMVQAVLAENAPAALESRRLRFGLSGRSRSRRTASLT